MYHLNFNWFNVTMFFSATIGFTFALLLIFSKRQSQRANRFLGVMLLVIVSWTFWVASLDIRLDNYFNSINVIPFTFSLALGPSIYFYVNYLCWPKEKINKHWMWHYSPVLLELMAHFAKVSESQAKGISPEQTEVFNHIYPIIQLASIISVGIYVLLSLKALKRFHDILKNNFSDYYKYQLHWLRRLITVFVLLELCWLPYTLVDYLLFDFTLSIEAYYPLYLLISSISIWIAIESFLRPELVSIKEPVFTGSREDESVSTDDINKGHWLEQEMTTHKYYLDTELNLKFLAEKLNMHPNNLSRLINKVLKKCFADFVNEYRVNEVISKFKDANYKDSTLLDIALDSGFSSKTTFNRIFKKFTNKTPLEFRNQ